MGVFTSPFVQPRTVRLEVGDGHWIDIKHQLSYGDMQAVASHSRGDLTRASLELVAAFLVDWSLVTDDGQPSVIDDDAKKVAALRALSMPAFTAIEEAIDRHRKAVEAEKKAAAPSGPRRSARRSA